MVQIVQNQFIPPANNVEALYLELHRCLIYGGIVLDLEDKVTRIRKAMRIYGGIVLDLEDKVTRIRKAVIVPVWTSVSKDEENSFIG